MSMELRVGIGEVMVGEGDNVLSAYGVGSCVVLILHDRQRKAGGLAHILLPVGQDSSTKYPRGALRELLARLERIGAVPDTLIAKIIGGAAMFEGFQKHAIGNRNVIQTREELARASIRIAAEDVFGSWGRTVHFHCASGRVTVKSFKHGEVVL